MTPPPLESPTELWARIARAASALRRETLADDATRSIGPAADPTRVPRSLSRGLTDAALALSGIETPTWRAHADLAEAMAAAADAGLTLTDLIDAIQAGDPALEDDEAREHVVDGLEWQANRDQHAGEQQ